MKIRGNNRMDIVTASTSYTFDHFFLKKFVCKRLIQDDFQSGSFELCLQDFAYIFAAIPYDSNQLGFLTYMNLMEIESDNLLELTAYNFTFGLRNHLFELFSAN